MLQTDLSKNPAVAWLLDPVHPGVRYLALRDLLNLPEDDPELAQARETAHREGPIATILAKMDPAGFWEKPGPGYSPKYKSTVWSLLGLAQLGARAASDPRIARACAYLMEHALNRTGQFSYNGAPSGTIDCLQGNLCWALLELGIWDARLETAYEWMARSVTGEGVAPQKETKAPTRYYVYKCGPDFACGANAKLPCAWGGTKVVLAFGRLPIEGRIAVIEQAIQRGIDFFLSVDPLTAAYPTSAGQKPNSDWWKFGFPVFYITDLLQVVEALAALGYARDPRLANTLDFIQNKQDEQGRWALEYSYAGKTRGEFGPLKKANPWVSLRALRALKAAGRLAEAA